MVSSMGFFPLPSSPSVQQLLGSLKKRQDQYCYPNPKHPSLRQHGYKHIKERHNGIHTYLGHLMLERALWEEFLPMIYYSTPLLQPSQSSRQT